MNLINVFLTPFFAITGLGLGALTVLLSFYLVNEASKIIDLLKKRLAKPKEEPAQDKNLTPRAGGVVE